MIGKHRPILHAITLILLIGLIGFIGTARTAQEEQETKYAWMGVRLSEVSEDDADDLDLDEAKGVLVVEVLPDTPAKAAGFVEKDVIRRMDDATIDSWSDLRNKLRSRQPGDVMKVLVVRGGREQILTITLGTRPPPARPTPPEIPN